MLLFLPSLLLSNLTPLTCNSPILINDAPELQGSKVSKIPTLPQPTPLNTRLGNAVASYIFTIKWDELYYNSNLLKEPRY